jgi:hypothetical protein
MVAKTDDATSGGFGQAFADAYALCLRAIPEARFEDLEDIREIATRLAGHARLAKNSEAELQSEEIRALAERRIEELFGALVAQPAMLAPAVHGGVRGRAGGVVRAAKLSAERRREIARRAAQARWEPAA